jgi:hypothetical protein
VRRQFELTPAEYDALLLALVVEQDSRAARLAAYLNDAVGQARPTLGLAIALAEVQGLDADPLRWSRRPILADGLLALEGDGPMPERALRIDHQQALRLVSLESVIEPTLTVSLPDGGLLHDLVLPPDLRSQVDGWAREIAGGLGVPLVVVTGPPGTGRSSLIRAAAGAVGRPVVEERRRTDDAEARMRLLRREARWYGAAIAVTVTSPADVHDLWAHIGVPPDLLFLEVPDDLVEAVALEAPSPPVLWRCAHPDIGTRAALWGRLSRPVADLTAEDCNALAASFRFGPAAIRAVVNRAALEHHDADGRADRTALAAAGRSHVGASLTSLADRLSLTYGREDLVLGDDIEREIDLALAWMRHQRTVLDTWQLGARIATGRGLTALFAGPPGTGKTMAAQVLARELDLDCYRVDLSRVVSKFIGETEENLSRVFDEAEIGGAVLFFDEADALFAKRTEIKDSRDRYANLEVSYLLQRMESFDGVAVLASNRSTDIDEAFLRRFQITALFRMPTPDERERIWRGLVPESASPSIDLRAVARAADLSGGEIKNCVLAAAYLAAAEHRSMEIDHVTAAIRRELAKSGRLVDEVALTALQPTA